MARRGGVHGARRRQRAGVHRRDALRIPDRVGPDGLSNWMDEKGYATLDDIRGRAVPNVTDWKYLNLKYDIKARIDRTAASSAGCAISRARTRRTRRSPRRRTACATSKWSIRNASGAIFACMCVRSSNASRWSVSIRATTRTGPRIRTIRQARTRGECRRGGTREAREEGCLTASGEAGHPASSPFVPPGPASVDAGADVLVECVR